MVKHLRIDNTSDPAAYWVDMEVLWPIGSLYFSVVSANPSTSFGFGTWIAFGTGRTLVGIDPAQTEFDTVEKTGGEKNHVLTVPELAAHTHVQDAHSHSLGLIGGTGLGVLGGGAVPGSTSTGSATATNQAAGADAAHNNLPPYVTVYIWKRTA